jgi:hypothetical protein
MPIRGRLSVGQATVEVDGQTVLDAPARDIHFTEAGIRDGFVESLFPEAGPPAEATGRRRSARAVPLTIHRRAEISPCGLFRWRLSRQWEPGGAELPEGGTLVARPAMCIIGLNPSKADGQTDDPTVRRGMAFAKRESCKRLEMANLGAYRATSPDDFLAASDPLGPDSLEAIMDAAEASDIVVVAWGARAKVDWLADRAADVLEMLHRIGRPPKCFRLTKDGHPEHPLYIPGDAPLIPFAPGWVEA